MRRSEAKAFERFRADLLQSVREMTANEPLTRNADSLHGPNASPAVDAFRGATTVRRHGEKHRQR